MSSWRPRLLLLLACAVLAACRPAADPAALHLFHDGQSLLYRAGVDLPPYQPRVSAPVPA